MPTADETTSLDAPAASGSAGAAEAKLLADFSAALALRDWEAAAQAGAALSPKGAERAMRRVADRLGDLSVAGGTEASRSGLLGVASALAERPLSASCRKRVASAAAHFGEASELAAKLIGAGEFPSLKTSSQFGASGENALASALGRKQWDLAQTLAARGVRMSPGDAARAVRSAAQSGSPALLAAAWEMAEDRMGEGGYWPAILAAGGALDVDDCVAAEWVLERSGLTKMSPDGAHARGQILRTACAGPLDAATRALEACARAFGGLAEGGSGVLERLAHGHASQSSGASDWLGLMQRAWDLGAGREDHGAAALAHAARNPRLREWLLEKGALKAKIQPAMVRAASSGDMEFYSWLTSHGVNPRDQERALCEAARARPGQNDGAVFDALMKAGPTQRALQMALTGAAIGGSENKLKALIAAGANPARATVLDSEEAPHAYPMREAARLGRVEIMRLLAENGADPLGRGKRGEPLRDAIDNECDDAALWLLQAGGLSALVARQVRADARGLSHALKEPFERAAAALEREELLKTMGKEKGRKDGPGARSEAEAAPAAPRKRMRI